ncbi:MAG: hypothetical protein CR991_11435 [Proteobacteria bacterium]|nr:MAG: hypothetical protein CR991_11435 [Pseudomonadota bacterium]
MLQFERKLIDQRKFKLESAHNALKQYFVGVAAELVSERFVSWWIAHPVRFMIGLSSARCRCN